MGRQLIHLLAFAGILIILFANGTYALAVDPEWEPKWSGHSCSSYYGGRPSAASYPARKPWEQHNQNFEKKITVLHPPSSGDWICGTGYQRPIMYWDDGLKKYSKGWLPLAAPACEGSAKDCHPDITAKYVCSNFHPDTPQVQSYEIWKGSRTYTGAYLNGGHATDREVLKYVICQEPTGKENAQWTPWLNRDNPDPPGDYEKLTDHFNDGNACAAPIGVQCRAVTSKQKSKDTGQNTICTRRRGFICRNKDQNGSRCLDYEVRFRCPSG